MGSHWADTVNAFQNQLLIVVVGFGAAFNVGALVAGAVNFYVIHRTGAIHPNLRAVLLAQSLSIGAYAGTELVLAALRFGAGSVSEIGPPMLGAFDSFACQFLNLIGHVLILERAIATVWVGRYENLTAPYFTVAWVAVLTTICGVNSINFYISILANNDVAQIGIGTRVLNYVALVVSLIEIFAIIRLGLYNSLKYTQNEFYRRTSHSLSERYQLSENVRTTRQLVPTFFAHFLELLLLNILLNLTPFFPPIAPISLFLIAVVNFSICISVIGFHSEARMRARRFYRRLLVWCLLAPSRGIKVWASASIASGGGGCMKEDNDEKRERHLSLGITHTEMHFEMMRRAWA